MRKITEEAIDAFMNHRRFKKRNTEVYKREFTTLLILFSNTIAYRYDDGSIEITTCGWNTVTTRERLNGIPGVHITSLKKQLYLNNEEWDGILIKI
jgi:hypothetical protein